ncbi:MAG TPA: transcriptional regulator AsnC [Pasteurellaceae bacterium]|nr:transcriptional regulator AsnC [Pasteurellaceae bacterium]
MQFLDNLDKQILKIIANDARKSYAEMAKQFGVSAGTIHVRIDKMRKLGIIQEMKAKLNERKLGYDVCCFIGVILKNAKDYQTVIDQLGEIDEVVEAYYTTGDYSIFIKVLAHSIEELHQILTKRIQAIDEIQSTETLISMQNPIKRAVAL